MAIGNAIFHIVKENLNNAIFAYKSWYMEYLRYHRILNVLTTLKSIGYLLNYLMCSINGQLGFFVSEVGNIGNYLTIGGVLDLEGLTNGTTYPSTVDILISGKRLTSSEIGVSLSKGCR